VEATTEIPVIEVKLIASALFDSVAELAAASPRLRMNHNFHAEMADNPHRLLNVLLSGTYVRPHRHTDSPKAESSLVLEGVADVIPFASNLAYHPAARRARHLLRSEPENDPALRHTPSRS
jgi:cupin fold WbuC family metalloprotein